MNSALLVSPLVSSIVQQVAVHNTRLTEVLTDGVQWPPPLPLFCQFLECKVL